MKINSAVLVGILTSNLVVTLAQTKSISESSNLNRIKAQISTLNKEIPCKIKPCSNMEEVERIQKLELENEKNRRIIELQQKLDQKRAVQIEELRKKIEDLQANLLNQSKVLSSHEGEIIRWQALEKRFVQVFGKAVPDSIHERITSYGSMDKTVKLTVLCCGLLIFLAFIIVLYKLYSLINFKRKTPAQIIRETT